MVNQLSYNQLLLMALDHLSVSSAHHTKPPDIEVLNTTQNSTNSLKHPTSPQFDYKYSKNKHLSQQIHKKKKNRNKQTHHKKKKLIKFHKHNNKHVHKKKTSKHHKKPKLKKSKSITPLNQNDNDIDDLYDAHYIKKHNEMTQKHQKIQVIDNVDEPYYLHTSSLSSNTLNYYNYKKKANKTNIIWVQSPQILHCSPSPMLSSPMLLPGSNLSCTTKCSSPFLLPVPCANAPKSPYNSPLLTHAGNKGEMLLGFEASDANIIFRSLADLHDVSRERSQISDYKYEGLQNYTNEERVNDDITYCLNILKAINNVKDRHISKISVDKLTEIESIVQQLKNKRANVSREEIGLSEDDEKTDSTFVQSSHLLLNTNTSNTTDEEHEDEDEYDDSNQSMVSGEKFMEETTSQDIVYYD